MTCRSLTFPYLYYNPAALPWSSSNKLYTTTSNIRILLILSIVLSYLPTYNNHLLPTNIYQASIVDGPFW